MRQNMPSFYLSELKKGWIERQISEILNAGAVDKWTAETLLGKTIWWLNLPLNRRINTVWKPLWARVYYGEENSHSLNGKLKICLETIKDIIGQNIKHSGSFVPNNCEKQLIYTD